MNNFKKLIFLVLAVGIFSCTEQAPPATPSTSPTTSVSTPEVNTNPAPKPTPEIGKVTMPDRTVSTSNTKAPPRIAPQPSTQLADASLPRKSVNPMTGNMDGPDPEFDDKAAEIAAKIEGMGNVDVGNVKIIKAPDKPNVPNLSDEAREGLYNDKIQEQMAFVLQLVSKQYRSGRLAPRLLKTPSGVEYVVVEKGKGKQAIDGSFIGMKSMGATLDGEVFEENFEKDRAFRVKLGTNAMIPGLEEAVKTMRAGGKAIFFIPAKLAYGSRGRIGVPPNSMVVYLLNLESVN